MDRKYYEDPERYNPDRFLGENSGGKNQVDYLPFGDGPRNCVAFRLAKLQAKLALVTMLWKFKYDIFDDCQAKNMQFDPIPFTLAPLNGLKLHISKR